MFCILGARLRYQEDVSNLYLFSFWFNRLLMGLVIGLADRKTKLVYRLSLGAFLGLFVSFAFYSSTVFYDLTGFLVGAVYGIVIVGVNILLTRKTK